MPLTQEYVRTKVWQHNGLYGQVYRAHQAMKAVLISSTTTDKAKIRAARLVDETAVLLTELKTRDDSNAR